MALTSLPEPNKNEREAPTNKYRPTARQYMIFGLAFIGMLLFYMVPVQIPFLLREMGVERNALSGVAIATTTLFGVFTSSRYSKILQRLTFAQIYVFIFTFGGIGYGLAAITESYALLIAAMAITGLAFGTLMPNTNMWLISESKPFNRGRIIGILTLSFFSGQFFSPIVLRPIALSGRLSTAFGVAAVFMFVLAAVLQLTYVRKTPTDLF
ncbi:MAG: hypothetical protein J4F31_00460 [Flavobacteriales bacterium]|nr:hypothetical protein [Flavobacteriales bacterium]